MEFGEWPGAVCDLLDDGNLLRAGKDTIEIRDWDNNRIWVFPLNAKLGLNQHHDMDALLNGNVLCLVIDKVSSADMYALGKDTAVDPGEIKLDKVIELKPIGLASAEIVWEWHFADHFIQDIDNTRPNFGVIAAHPELLDINYSTVFTTDFIHGNGMDYNPTLDQIVLSAQSLNEIYIIDHSTITLEAAGHSGGQVTELTKDGDVLWIYRNSRGEQSYLRFEPVINKNSSIFRAEKYPVNFIRFQGKDLNGKGILEGTNAISDTRQLSTGILSVEVFNLLLENPVRDNLVRFTKFIEKAEVILYNMQGKTLLHLTRFEGKYLNLDIVSVVYQLLVKNEEGLHSRRILVD